MSPTEGFDRDQSPAPTPEPARPAPPRDPEAQAPPEADPPAPDDEEEAPARPGLLQVALSLIARLPRAALGSERHERNVGGPPAEAETDAPPGPELIAPPLLAFLRSRENRVGLVAVISCAVLVGAFLVKRNWNGKTVTMAMHKPGEGTPAPASPGEDAEKKKAESKDKAGTTPSPSPSPTSTPPPSGATPTPTPPTAPAAGGPEPGLGHPAPAPATVPPSTADSSDPAAVLGAGAGSLPTTLPPPSTAPDGPAPRLPDAPAPGVDPMPEPLPAPMPPPATSAPTPASTPAPAPESTLPSPPATTEPAAPPAADSRPKETDGAGGLPPLGEPPSMAPPNEPTRATPTPTPRPSTVPDLPAAPAPELPAVPASELPAAPAPAVAPPAAPDRMATAPASGPVPTEKPPTLETVPPGSLESSATKTSTAGMPGLGGGGHWLTIPSGGRRIVGVVPIVSTPAEAQVDAPRVADGPRFSDDPAVVDQVEPVVHTVEPGENFFTISKLYYRSGRFYKALHAANRKQVPDIRQLWVGTVLRIPPFEALDRNLIDPPDRKATDEPAPSLVRRATKQADPPGADPDLGVPPRRRPVVVDPEAAATPRRPTYKVKPYETLRSIARDTLNDPRRDREIYTLNRDILDDITSPLPAGATLTLPADATVGRRAAR